MSKRTLDSFFAPPSKRARPNSATIVAEVATPPNDTEPPEVSQVNTSSKSVVSSPPLTPAEMSKHSTYPWPVPYLPAHIESSISDLVIAQGKELKGQPDLDLLYFQPFVPRSTAHDFFNFLRSELFFYRVQYTIKRFGTETVVNTPRYTTVFGLDETSRFSLEFPDSDSFDGPIVEAATRKPVPSSKYRCTPRPIPSCLDHLRRVTEAATNTSYNFCLVNYYATGSDSISFHSDDEYFLGPDPVIASFTLGATREFVMKHKPPKDSTAPPVDAKQIKLSLADGDMVLMRGPTQTNWLHSIPKRKGVEADRGRINVTLRKAILPAGTENYYRYNVGGGGVYKWDKGKKEMVPWTKGCQG